MVPSRRKVQLSILSEVDAYREKMAEQIQMRGSTKISFTIDAWSSRVFKG